MNFAFNNRRANRSAFAAVLTALVAAATLRAEAATCTNGQVTIVPSPLPSSAYHTFAGSNAGTRIYSYDLITVQNGKTSQNYLPTALFTCDGSGIHVTANGLTTLYPLSATVSSHSLRLFAVFPGMAPTASEAAQIRLGRTRLVRTVTAASAAAEAEATLPPAPTPSPTATAKHKHFL